MTTAILVGAGSGALHAVVAPDHLLSLGPIAIRAPSNALKVGSMWGVGHGIGTLLLGLPLVVLAPLVQLERLSGISDRLAGAVLLGTALWSFWSARRARVTGTGQTVDPRGPLLVGFLHGLTGVGALVLMLPALISGTMLTAVWYLVAFAVGSTIAMAALTGVLGAVGRRLEERAILTSQIALLVVAAVLGGWLLVFG